jgi:hypothetical protein
VGDTVFERFSAPRNLTLAYHFVLADEVDARLRGGLATELRRVVTSLLERTEAPRSAELSARLWEKEAHDPSP